MTKWWLSIFIFIMFRHISCLFWEDKSEFCSRDDHLTFIPHVNLAMKNCNSKLFLMRELTKLGMNLTSSCSIYCSNITSTLTYCACDYFQFLSDTTKPNLGQVHMSATRIISPWDMLRSSCAFSAILCWTLDKDCHW